MCYEVLYCSVTDVFCWVVCVLVCYYLLSGAFAVCGCYSYLPFFLLYCKLLEIISGRMMCCVIGSMLGYVPWWDGLGWSGSWWARVDCVGLCNDTLWCVVCLYVFNRGVLCCPMLCCVVWACAVLRIAMLPVVLWCAVFCVCCAAVLFAELLCCAGNY